jgi:hypothetical protein
MVVKNIKDIDGKGFCQSTPISPICRSPETAKEIGSPAERRGQTAGFAVQRQTVAIQLSADLHRPAVFPIRTARLATPKESVSSGLASSSPIPTGR